MDLNQLLLETDAPYLPPQQFRGETNYPSNIKYIYDFVAEQLNIDQDKL
jgi:TatD DNase family protein